MKEKRSFRRALITGIAGSGGSYLAEYMVQNHPEVEVSGIARWHSTSLENLSAIRDKVKIYEIVPQSPADEPLPQTLEIFL